MADDTKTTRPGDVPGVLKTGEDGSVPDTGGRRAWVWMQDSEEGGGGRFDVLSNRVDVWLRKGASVVPGYPLHFGPSGRLARPRVNLSGNRDAGPVTSSEQPPPPDPTLALPASALGAVEPTGDRQPDTERTAEPGEPLPDVPADSYTADAEPLPPAESDDQADDDRRSADTADAGDDGADQAAGEPAAAETTTTKSSRRGARR